MQVVVAIFGIFLGVLAHAQSSESSLNKLLHGSYQGKCEVISPNPVPEAVDHALLKAYGTPLYKQTRVSFLGVNAYASQTSYYHDKDCTDFVSVSGDARGFSVVRADTKDEIFAIHYEHDYLRGFVEGIDVIKISPDGHEISYPTTDYTLTTLPSDLRDINFDAIYVRR